MALSDYIETNILFWKIIFSLIQWLKGIISIGLCMGIIIYERKSSDNYKTLLNHLNVLLMYSSIGLSLIVFCLGGVLMEQMPVNVCIFQSIGSHLCMTSFFLGMTQMVFIRFLYSCWFKGYGRLNEEFWITFFKIGTSSTISTSFIGTLCYNIL